MVCFNPKYVNLIPYNKVDEKTGEVYLTRRPVFIKKFDFEPEKSTALPCRKCLGCRIDYANEWATRAYLESQKHTKNTFLTLTYNNDNLPVKKTLVKADLQKFFKRLRKRGYKFSYIAAGEYGSKTLRPHYHILLFGYWPVDAKIFQQNITKDYLFTSEELSKIWGKGFILLGQVNYETASYVARYTMKKTYNSDEINKKRGVEPEFLLTSRRPAIAKPTEEEIKKYMKSYSVPVVKKTGTTIKKIPQYIAEKIKKYDRYEYFIQATKRTLENQKRIQEKLKKTDLNFGWYKKQNDAIMSKKYEKLKRLDI